MSHCGVMLAESGPPRRRVEEEKEDDQEAEDEAEHIVRQHRQGRRVRVRASGFRVEGLVVRVGALGCF